MILVAYVLCIARSCKLQRYILLSYCELTPTTTEVHAGAKKLFMTDGIKSFAHHYSLLYYVALYRN